jgi:PucR family transcriptional regulator, purine catabolism regulatory protein
MTPDRLIEFAEELARVAAAGGGPKALAALLSESTGAGVLVEDATWRHIASAGKGSLPATARGLSGSGTHTVPIGRSASLGHLSVFPKNGSDDALPMARLTAAAIGLELARESDGGRNRRRTFWERLAGGAYHDLSAAREDATSRGISISQSYVCIALETDAASDEDLAPALADLRALAAETFRAGEADVGTIERGVTLAVLVPAPREIDAENAKTAALLLPKTAAKRKSHLHVTGGVFAPVPPLDVGRGVAGAETALTIVRRVYGSGRVAAYDDLGAYPLLHAGAEAAQLRQFAQHVLAPLRSYDEKHQTELERTLGVYFASGQNVKTTAAELNVHRHTVFYRLRQIGEIAGRSLESPHDQLTLRLAIAIDALHD